MVASDYRRLGYRWT